uniref:EGF-like domain-containing protein n=1 Tax=Strongyloides papillosus TaxID=174720 RepID=A0A0N5CAU7_STREA
MISRYILIVLQISLLCYVKSHVSLLYPPPRYPPFDFLDTKRTVGACGVGRNSKPNYITFLTKTGYDIFWNMPLIHKGGFRISLINQKGDLQEQLTPFEGTFYKDSQNETLTSYKVKFTNSCPNCTLVLEKEQKELSDSGIFHSCSDIQVIDVNKENEDNINDVKCSGHGVFNGISCNCDALYTGNRCEFKSSCTKDSDCKNSGKCISMKTNPSEKNCYCKYGFFGNKCEKKFIPTASDSNCFNYHYTLSQDKRRFQKYGLYNTPCYKNYKLNDDDVVYFRIVNEEIEIILDFKTTSWLSIGWRPLELDASCRLFPDVSGTDNQNEGFSKNVIESSLHPMDCNDIIFASVHEDYLRIGDMYSRDRSTPLLDTILEGEDSLSAAYGAEIKDINRTVIMFRRNIREIEPTDMPLGPGKMSFIWAKGFNYDNESDDITRKFYEKDSFKYHGPKNRGVAIFEMVSKENMPNNGRLIFIPEINQSVMTINPKTDDNSSKTGHKVDEVGGNNSSLNNNGNDNKNNILKNETTTSAQDKKTKNTSSSSNEDTLSIDGELLKGDIEKNNKKSKKIKNTSDEEVNNFDELENESNDTSESNETLNMTLKSNKSIDDKDLPIIVTTSIPDFNKNKTSSIKSLSNDLSKIFESKKNITTINGNEKKVKNIDASGETVVIIYNKTNKLKDTINMTTSPINLNINETKNSNDEEMVDENDSSSNDVSMSLEDDETNTMINTTTTEQSIKVVNNNKNSVWLPPENNSPSSDDTTSNNEDVKNIKNLDDNEVSSSSLYHNAYTFIRILSCLTLYTLTYY